MKYPLSAIVLVILVFSGFGCRSVTPVVTRHPFVYAPEEASKSLAFNLEGGSMPVLASRDPTWTIPDDILPDQFRDAYRVTDSVIFGLILRPNMYYSVEAPADPYGGVILTMDGGKTWSPVLFAPTSSDTNEVIRFNPIGISIERKLGVNSYVIDFVDSRGAGSGEGNLVRYRTTDGKTWKRDSNCYYYGDSTKYFLKGSEINPPQERDYIRAPFALEKTTCPDHVHD